METRTLMVPFERPGVTLRTALPDAALRLFQDGRAAQQAGKATEAIPAYTAAAQVAEEAGDADAAAFLWKQAGALQETQGQWPSAQRSYEAAWALLKERGDAASRSRILAALGECSANRNDFAAARTWYERALEAEDTAAGYEAWAAVDLNNLGNVCYARGDLAAPEQSYSRAVAIYEQADPQLGRGRRHPE